VPDGVVIGLVVSDVEEGADGVEGAAGYEEDERVERHRCVEGLDGEYTGPAHYDVEDYGYGFVAAGEECFEYNADCGAAPYDAEQCPADPAVEYGVAVWRVCSGDEQEYGHMIEFSEQSFCAGVCEAVVQR